MFETFDEARLNANNELKPTHKRIVNVQSSPPEESVFIIVRSPLIVFKKIKNSSEVIAKWIITLAFSMVLLLKNVGDVNWI